MTFIMQPRTPRKSVGIQKENFRNHRGSALGFYMGPYTIAKTQLSNHRGSALGFYVGFYISGKPHFSNHRGSALGSYVGFYISGKPHLRNHRGSALGFYMPIDAYINSVQSTSPHQPLPQHCKGGPGDACRKGDPGDASSQH